MTRLLVFDLDGTLIDSRRDLAESANALLAESGLAPHAEAAIGRMVGDGAATLVERAFRAHGSQPPPNALARFLQIYEARLLRCTRPYPQIDEVLLALSVNASLGILTNKPLASTRHILEGLNLARHFRPEFVLGGDGPLPRKPDPAGLLHLCDRAAIRPEATTLIGDSPVDWKTAQAAGTRVCLARYGFGFETFAPGPIDGRVSFATAPIDLLTVL
jgi:phosphoglycolate phosphatase